MMQTNQPTKHACDARGILSQRLIVITTFGCRHGRLFDQTRSLAKTFVHNSRTRDHGRRPLVPRCLSIEFTP